MTNADRAGGVVARYRAVGNSVGMQPDRDGPYALHSDHQSLLIEAQAECEEQARLNGMGAERELALLARAERAEADAESWRKLKADIDETPCKYPCLRDCLADWMRSVDKARGGRR